MVYWWGETDKATTTLQSHVPLGNRHSCLMSPLRAFVEVANIKCCDWTTHNDPKIKWVQNAKMWFASYVFVDMGSGRLSGGSGISPLGYIPISWTLVGILAVVRWWWNLRCIGCRLAVAWLLIAPSLPECVHFIGIGWTLGNITVGTSSKSTTKHWLPSTSPHAEQAA